MGDRECPNCENISLIEQSYKTWKCLICGEEFDVDYLDEKGD